MSICPEIVHQGPGTLWLYCQPPAPGNRLLIDANGIPTQGAPVDAGATYGAGTLTLGGRAGDIECDQESGAIDRVLISDAYSIDVTMGELTLANVQAALGVAAYAVGLDAGLPATAQVYEEVALGGLTPVPSMCVAVISPRCDARGLYVVSVLYAATATPEVKLPFSRKKPTIWKVAFRGLNLTGRGNGDRTGKIYRQVLTQFPPAPPTGPLFLSQLIVEALVMTPNSVQLSQLTVEALVRQTGSVRLTQVALEALVQ